MITLRENEYHLLQALAQAPGPVQVALLATELGLDQSLVLAAAATLEAQDLSGRQEQSYTEYRIDKLGTGFAATGLRPVVFGVKAVLTGQQG